MSLSVKVHKITLVQMQVESIAKKEVPQEDVLQEPLKNLQKSQQEMQNNQLEMQKNQQEIQKNQQEILNKLAMLEEARKSESMKRKQPTESFENEEEEVDEEALTKKKKWKPEKFPCEKCGKMVATHWKGRHDLGYCKSSVHGPPAPEDGARKVMILPQTPYYTTEEENFRSEDLESSKSKTYSYVDKYPEAILRSILAPKTCK